ncbi:MAG: VWA domain-containing protein [Acidobacteria bacterium]|nr:VWA domain-containing protein [Acidobacteriota bacterium]
MSVRQDKARCMRYLAGFLCLAVPAVSLCILSLPGATSPAAQSDAAFKIRVDVELVTAEVVVLDKKGKPVHNLKKEDFRLYEDGKQQEIASFDEVAEEAAAIVDPANIDRNVPRGKTVLILFDDSTITATHTKMARDSAEKFIKEHMRPFDFFAVAAYDHSLHVLQSFTDDPEKILAAIRAPAVSGSARRESAMDQPPLERQMEPQQPSKRDASDSRIPDAYMRYQSESFFRALDALSRSVERIRGRKSILLFSEDISLSDESRSLYQKALNSARKANVVFYTIDTKGLESKLFGAIHSPLKNKESQAFLRTAFMPGGMFQQQGGQKDGGGSGSGGKGGGTGGGSGSGSTSTPSYDRRGDAINDPRTAGHPDFGSEAMRMEKEVLRSFSSETGGFPIYNTANFDQELAKLDEQLSNYYILGFQSGNPKRDGSVRKIEVKTDLKGVTLRYRKNYVDRRPLDTLASSREEKSLLNAIASPASAVRLPLSFRALYFYETPGLTRVLISSKIGLEKAEFKKKGGQLSCSLNVMGVAYAENDTVAARFSETVPVFINEEKDRGLPRTFAYSNYFKLRPGKYRLKLAASDGANNLGSLEQPMDIPAPVEGQIAASSLVVAERVSHLPALIQNIQAKLLDESDPLVYSGMQISPSIENKSPVGSPLAVFFKLYNPAGGLDHWKAEVKAKLLNETGREYTLPPISLENDPSQSLNTAATIACTLRFKDMEPGKYRLIIEATDPQSFINATVQTDLELCVMDENGHPSFLR